MAIKILPNTLNKFIANLHSTPQFKITTHFHHSYQSLGSRGKLPFAFFTKTFIYFIG